MPRRGFKEEEWEDLTHNVRSPSLSYLKEWKERVPRKKTHKLSVWLQCTTSSRRESIGFFLSFLSPLGSLLLSPLLSFHLILLPQLSQVVFFISWRASSHRFSFYLSRFRSVSTTISSFKEDYNTTTRISFSPQNVFLTHFSSFLTEWKGNIQTE